MAEFKAIRIERGSGGFGGPLTVMPKEGKDKVEIGRASCRERV